MWQFRSHGFSWGSLWSITIAKSSWGVGVTNWSITFYNRRHATLLLVLIDVSVHS